MSRRLVSVGALSLATGLLIAVAAPVATADSAGAYGVNNTAGSVASAPSVAVAAAPDRVAPQSTHVYPSSSSTVIGSVGFIDADEVGYFWSVSRGDSVAESFNGPGRVRKAILKLDVVQNVLSSGAFVNWTVSINGTDVGSFTVNQGQLGPVTHKFTFPKITGGTYLVKTRVTNEVAGGQGSHTLAYAGAFQHSLTLKKRA